MEPNKKTLWPGSFLKRFNNEWFSFLIIILAAAGVYFFVQAFLFRSYVVEGQSMETTLSHNDRLIINKLPRTLSRITKNAYIPQRGDIVIFNQAGPLSTEKQLIKRVIGLPGERVVVKKGALIVFNSSHPNGYDPDKAGLYFIAVADTPGSVDITLKANQIFVLGDNRENSEDSRYFGAVAVNKVVGKLAFRLMPLNEAQRF